MSDRLFDPKATVPPKCLACGATEKRDCEHDRDRELGMASVTRRRPKSCISSAQLSARDPFPQGF